MNLPDALSAAAESGRISALAASGQRDLADRAAAYPELFPARPFDGTLFGSVALSTAFGAPWCTREQLAAANRAALWVFAVDWRIDYQCRSGEEADAVVRRAVAVADGREPDADDPLGRFLAELTALLGPALRNRSAIWRTELGRMLAAMARERRWALDRTVGGPPPSIEEYLDNADNFGSSFVNVTHWLATDDPRSLAHLSELISAGRLVQRVLRLVNDLATADRDQGWGDLNALMLGLDRAAVEQRIAALVEQCLGRLEPLRDSCPRDAEYLARQIGFSSGFYRVGDFWGRL